MQITSILAIYFLLFVMTAFAMLPFGVRTAEESGEEIIPGQAESAPVNFKPGKIVIRASIIAAILTTLFVLNFEYGWISAQDLNIFPRPED